MLILTIYSPKSAILDNYPLLKVKIMGKFFHNFFGDWGKNNFFWQNIHLWVTQVTQMVTHRTLVLRGSLGLSKLGLRREVPSMLTHTINIVNITFNIVFIDRLSFGFELDNVNLLIQLLWRDQC